MEAVSHALLSSPLCAAVSAVSNASAAFASFSLYSASISATVYELPQ